MSDSTTMLEFNDLLEKNKISPSNVLIMRHRPIETSLRRVLPWFASDKPHLFNAYQQIQAGVNAERALQRASILASFIGEKPKLATFVGLFEVGESREISEREYWQIPAMKELHRYGLQKGALRQNSLWFDLKQAELFQQHQGRLVIEWSGLERSWYRWAHKNTFPIAQLLETSSFAEQMPDWKEISLTWMELNSLPSAWQTSMSQWRGIYLIFDALDGKSYVGSAYGADNILGRWLNYASTGHGGNKALRKRDPTNFIFSILERVSPDLDTESVVSLESTWKRRLNTREYGLNEN